MYGHLITHIQERFIETKNLLFPGYIDICCFIECWNGWNPWSINVQRFGCGSYRRISRTRTSATGLVANHTRLQFVWLNCIPFTRFHMGWQNISIRKQYNGWAVGDLHFRDDTKSKDHDLDEVAARGQLELLSHRKLRYVLTIFNQVFLR